MSDQHVLDLYQVAQKQDWLEGKNGEGELAYAYKDNLLIILWPTSSKGIFKLRYGNQVIATVCSVDGPYGVITKIY